jgi:hypothetical protein
VQSARITAAFPSTSIHPFNPQPPSPPTVSLIGSRMLSPAVLYPGFLPCSLPSFDVHFLFLFIWIVGTEVSPVSSLGGSMVSRARLSGLLVINRSLLGSCVARRFGCASLMSLLSCLLCLGLVLGPVVFARCCCRIGSFVSFPALIFARCTVYLSCSFSYMNLFSRLSLLEGPNIILFL